MITSVLELARYKVGYQAWWLIFKNQELEPLAEEQKWMEEHHPKVLFDEQGPYRKTWPYRAKLPRLHDADFSDVVALLSSDFIVQEFPIVEVVRSRDSAEFFYSNQDDEWMPESCLFDTDTAARRERSRIVNMIKKWGTRQTNG